MKKLLCILLAVVLVSAVFAGCNNTDTAETTAPSAFYNPTEPSNKEFLKKGIKISLPDEFEDYTEMPAGEGYTFLYAGSTSGVHGTEAAKDAQPDSVTDLASYAAYQAQQHSAEAAQKDGVWYIIYEDLTMNEPQTYVCAFYEGENCYWNVEAYSTSRDYQDNPEILWGYVTAVTFE